MVNSGTSILISEYEMKNESLLNKLSDEFKIFIYSPDAKELSTDNPVTFKIDKSKNEKNYYLKPKLRPIIFNFIYI